MSALFSALRKGQRVDGVRALKPKLRVMSSIPDECGEAEIVTMCPTSSGIKVSIEGMYRHGSRQFRGLAWFNAALDPANPGDYVCGALAPGQELRSANAPHLQALDSAEKSTNAK